MSRMYDRMLRKHPKWRRWGECQVVAIDNIAEMTRGTKFSLDELPVCKPPFEQCFVEFLFPDHLISARAKTENNFPIFMGTVVRYEDALSKVTLLPVIETGGRHYDGSPFTPVSMDGNPIRVSILDDGHLGFEHDELARIHRIQEVCSAFTTEEAQCLGGAEQWQFYAASLERLAICLTFAAFAFMHCKNASLVEHSQSTAVIKRWRKKYNQRPVKYYTLNVDGMMPVLRSEGQLETNGILRAMHICRGHFATYSPERPLFGRVAGTFWIPAHVRGADTSRCVVKDYSIGSSAEPAGPQYAEEGARFPAGTQVVYFVQSVEGGPVKIGETSNLQQRMKDLQQATPLKLLHALPGDRECEQWIHRELKQHRQFGEWFTPHQEVFGLIAEAQRLNFATIEQARERYVPLRIRKAIPA